MMYIPIWILIPLALWLVGSLCLLHRYREFCRWQHMKIWHAEKDRDYYMSLLGDLHRSYDDD